ncbi:MAG: hypothetical protein GTN70_05775 [Deltaproteobacteria bacterium]|nr:hypothetical protein [Deltaproteobacteria bacterium]NIS77189.1 hypothetical protein [Deltaproteobacteria bacterium]
MRKYVQSTLILLAIALFVGGYVYLRHGMGVHRVLARDGSGKQGDASEYYTTYYGRLPDVPVNGCRGIVLFYLSADGASLVPVPFFITAPDKSGALIAGKILSGLPLMAMSEYLRPFHPGGGKLENISIKGDRVSMKVRLPGGVSMQNLSLLARSFLEAYSQVNPEVSRVLMDAGGGLVAEDDLLSPWPGRLTVRDPGPPRILDAFLVADSEGESPRELRVIFDRPLDVTSFRVEGKEGEPISGRLYLSEFSMAGIFRTAGPLGIDAGESFVLTFSVNDFRGRHSEVERSFIARVRLLGR